MEKKFKFIGHACIEFNFNGIKVYIDPYDLAENRNDADIIFVTHNHFDHYSVEDIKKLIKEDTIVVLPKNIEAQDFLTMFVENSGEYECKGIKFETIPAYNIAKQYHKKEDGGIGYILEFENIRYYIAGDTDITDESRRVKCDVAFVPVGGTYTMDYKEAASLINELKPQIAVPIHYGKVVGSITDVENFEKLVEKEIKIYRS